MIKKSIILGASMVMLSGGILVSAAQGTTVSGASKTTSYHGWVEGCLLYTSDAADDRAIV